MILAQLGQLKTLYRELLKWPRFLFLSTSGTFLFVLFFSSYPLKLVFNGESVVRIKVCKVAQDFYLTAGVLPVATLPVRSRVPSVSPPLSPFSLFPLSTLAHRVFNNYRGTSGRKNMHISGTTRTTVRLCVHFYVLIRSPFLFPVVSFCRFISFRVLERPSVLLLFFFFLFLTSAFSFLSVFLFFFLCSFPFSNLGLLVLGNVGKGRREREYRKKCAGMRRCTLLGWCAC